ncbi:hypothetical protein ACIO02_34195 [Streptomyces sp. NPDC087568]|uniref:hypothetical protein n=1 Tax=Streptomyces sp. NPDC087568 TaxID=3365799 RepID=UPI0037FAF75B
MTAPFCRAAAERSLGRAVVEEIRRQVDAAPPLRPVQRTQVRAVFATARPVRDLTPTARAA